MSFIVIGENIHATRIVLRAGKLVVPRPDGGEAIRYTSADGVVRHLPIPESVKSTQDYEEGRVKHVGIAIRTAMSGHGDAAADGFEYIRAMVNRQVKSGADFLDLNVDEISIRLSEQKEAMRWLVRVVEPLSPKPLSIDSSNLEIIQAGLDACEGRAGTPMLNSASLERIEALEIASGKRLPVVVTAAGEKGMPQNDEERVVNASRMVDAALARGIPSGSIYIDALVFPISVEGQFGNHCLSAIRRLREKYGPEIHITGGFSNVSFGLPMRRLINDVFLRLAMEAGADSGIIDPVAANVVQVLALDRELRAYQLAEDMLLGRDCNCKNFLRAYRKGELQPATASA